MSDNQHIAVKSVRSNCCVYLARDEGGQGGSGGGGGGWGGHGGSRGGSPARRRLAGEADWSWR